VIPIRPGVFWRWPRFTMEAPKPIGSTHRACCVSWLPSGRTAASVLQAMRIIAEAVIFWAGRLKQAGKIRNVELSAGIFCKEIESRGAKRIRKRGCNGRSAPTRFSLESASGHP
jgi:hypothetical protein